MSRASPFVKHLEVVAADVWPLLSEPDDVARRRQYVTLPHPSFAGVRRRRDRDSPNVPARANVVSCGDAVDRAASLNLDSLHDRLGQDSLVGMRYGKPRLCDAVLREAAAIASSVPGRSSGAVLSLVNADLVPILVFVPVGNPSRIVRAIAGRG